MIVKKNYLTMKIDPALSPDANQIVSLEKLTTNCSDSIIVVKNYLRISCLYYFNYFYFWFVQIIILDLKIHIKY